MLIDFFICCCLRSLNTERSKHTCAARLLEVGLHAVVVREHRRGGSDLGSHVADCGHSCTLELNSWSEICGHCSSFPLSSLRVMSQNHTRARDGVNSRSVILHDGPGAALHGEDAGDLQDDVLRRRPTRQGPRQLHSNHLAEEGGQVYERQRGS